MRKLLQLVPATLFLLFTACQAPSPKRETSSFSTVFSSPTSIRELPPPTESDVWDTSDVDISDVNSNRKLISFTFDDCPSKTMESIFTVFAAYNEQNPDCKASATFFFNGARFDEQTPHLLHAALALGMELGNHTHSHVDLTRLSDEALLREINRTDELLEKADGKRRHLLRAPFGRVNERVKALAPTPLIDWTIDPLDWTGVSEEEIYRAIFDNRFSGAIALMHDGYENTVAALKRLLPALKADGYQVVSLSKMSKAHDCVLRRGSVYIRARKQK